MLKGELAAMLKDELLPVIREVMTDMQTALRKSQADQGHTLTGRLSQSTDFEIEASDTEIRAKMFMEDYGLNVEFGVKANRIPFSPPGKRGGTSLYIQNLIEFFEKRGLETEEATGAAFATAYVHSREGMPTKASSKYSTTGQRTGFISAVLQDEKASIFEKIEKKFGVSLEFIFVNNFRVLENVVIKL